MAVQINKQSFSTNKNQSLLITAFEVLLNNLGPQKASRLWQILTPLRGDYISERQKLFKGKSINNLAKLAQKFNRK